MKFNLNNLGWWIFAVSSLYLISNWYKQIDPQIESKIIYPIVNILILILLSYWFIRTVFFSEKGEWKLSKEEIMNCPLCSTPREYSEKYDAYYCPSCLYWLEKICPDRDCTFCKNRPKYPKK